MKKEEKKLKIAFVVGVFPVISETFIINQIADLLDRGVEVEIFILTVALRKIFRKDFITIRWRIYLIV